MAKNDMPIADWAHEMLRELQQQTRLLIQIRSLLDPLIDLTPLTPHVGPNTAEAQKSVPLAGRDTWWT